MAGVGTNSDSFGVRGRNRGPQLRQFFEGGAQGGATAGRGFQQDAHLPDPFQALGVGQGVPSQASFPVIDIVARVRHHGGDFQGPGALQLGDESRYGAGT